MCKSRLCCSCPVAPALYKLCVLRVQTFPLPLLYVGNQITGLFGTKRLKQVLLSALTRQNVQSGVWGAFSLTLPVLLHQFAHVYSPQKVLHPLHHAGWGLSAQVGSDTHSYSFTLLLSSKQLGWCWWVWLVAGRSSPGRCRWPYLRWSSGRLLQPG